MNGTLRYKLKNLITMTCHWYICMYHRKINIDHMAICKLYISSENPMIQEQVQHLMPVSKHSHPIQLIIGLCTRLTHYLLRKLFT